MPWNALARARPRLHPPSARVCALPPRQPLPSARLTALQACLWSCPAALALAWASHAPCRPLVTARCAYLRWVAGGCSEAPSAAACAVVLTEFLTPVTSSRRVAGCACMCAQARAGSADSRLGGLGVGAPPCSGRGCARGPAPRGSVSCRWWPTYGAELGRGSPMGRSAQLTLSAAGGAGHPGCADPCVAGVRRPRGACSHGGPRVGMEWHRAHRADVRTLLLQWQRPRAHRVGDGARCGGGAQRRGGAAGPAADRCSLWTRTTGGGAAGGRLVCVQRAGGGVQVCWYASNPGRR